LYALQSPLESQAYIRDTSIEELASIYVKELQALFPEGPYHLAGLSLGGLIALEMFQQICAQGKQPGLLILFDTFVPGCHYHVPARGQLSYHWRKLRNQGAVYLLQRAALKIEHWWGLLLRRAQAVGCLCYELVGRSLPAGLRYPQVEEAHKRALWRYTVQFYPGKITLMRALEFEQTGATRRNPTLGWETVAGGGLEIHDVPGSHYTMCEEPNVRTLAETLKPILSSFDSNPESETAGRLSLTPGRGLLDRA
jgi:aspartate racemase